MLATHALPPQGRCATIDPTGAINCKTPTATIGGTVACSAAARATVAGTISQGSRTAPDPSGGAEATSAASRTIELKRQ